MNITRVIIDGIMMSAVFNIIAALILTINPVIFTTSFPKEIQEIAPKNPHFLKHKILFALFVILPISIFSIISSYLQNINGFWKLFWCGYIQWFIINLGDFFLLDLFLREKMGDRWELPNTHGNNIYKRCNWMKKLAIPEHFIQWPLIICPLFGFIYSGIGLLLR